MAMSSSSLPGTATTAAFCAVLQIFFGTTEPVQGASSQHTNISRRQRISFLLCKSDKVCDFFGESMECCF